MPALYPVFLRLEGLSCLVVGGGGVAAGKVRQLLECGARVIVVAPVTSVAIDRLERESPGEEERRPPIVKRRPFAVSDLDGVSLVIAATDEREVNRRVSDLARARGIWSNAVDDPPCCTFFAPSVLRRGHLQVAISTSGESPLLAQWLRRRLETILSTRWETYVEWLGQARRRVHARSGRPFPDRVNELRRLMTDETMELLWAGAEEEFVERMERWSSFLPAEPASRR